MKKKRRGVPADGRARRQMIARLAAREAYHDALYALLLEDAERSLRDPKRREKVNRALRDLLEDMLQDFK